MLFIALITGIGIGPARVVNELSSHRSQIWCQISLKCQQLLFIFSLTVMGHPVFLTSLLPLQIFYLYVVLRPVPCLALGPALGAQCWRRQ